MIISIDTEEYVKYDGTKLSKEKIMNSAIGKTLEYINKYGLTKGKMYPVLDAREFALGCAIINKAYNKPKYFTNSVDMYDWVDSTIDKNKKNGHRTFVYAHNMEFDYYAIAKHNLLDNKTKHVCFTPFIAIRKQKGYFLDTMSFFRCSLDQVGKDLGYKKGMLPNEIDSTFELYPYLTRDVEIVAKAINKLKDDLASIGFRPRKLLTAGQIAMTCFLTFCRRNGTERLFTEWNEEKQIRQVIKCRNKALVKPASRGGDNTAAQIGSFEKVNSYDFRGYYGDIMANHLEFPKLQTETLIKEPPIIVLKKLINNMIGVAQCEVEAPSMELPVLPTRIKLRQTYYMIFPSNKTMKSRWTFTELQEALKFGYKIKSCDWCVTWDKLCINPLKEYTLKLWELENSDPIRKPTFKLIGRNTYGKWLQNKVNKDFKFILRSQVNEHLNDGYKVEGFLSNIYIMSKVMSDYEPSYVNPIVGIQITALGRINLRKTLRMIEPGDRLYWDTDGWMNTEEYGSYEDKFDIGTGLGQVKVIARKMPCKILGEKRYSLGKKAFISGIPKWQVDYTTIRDEQPVSTKVMYGLKEGFKHGNLNMVGSFREKTVSMEPHCKSMIPLPSSIDEIKLFEQHEVET